MTETPSLQSVLDSVRPLLRASVSLHWLNTRNKRPVEKNWSTVERYDEALLLSKYRPGYNIGFRPGVWSKVGNLYLHVIDLDIRRTEFADEAWETLLQIAPTARTLPSVISGSGGESRHLYFLSEKPFGSRKLARSAGFDMVFDAKLNREVKKSYWEIDIGGTGKNIVLPPSIHPDTGEPYVWERPLELSMPYLMTVSAEALIENGVRIKEGRGALDPEDLETILALEPKDFDDDEIVTFLDDLPEEWVEDRALWLTVGQALHHQYRGSDQGFTIWCEWAEQSKKYDEENAAYIWKSIRADSINPITILTVRRAALDHRLKEEIALEADDYDGFDNLNDILGATAAAVKQVSFDDLLGPTSNAIAAAITAEDTPNITLPVISSEPTIQRNSDFHVLLARNEEGELKSQSYNISTIFKNDLRTYGTAAFNEFTQMVVLKRRPGRAKKKEHSNAKEVVNLTGRLWELGDPTNGDAWSDSHDIAVRIMFEAPMTAGGYGIKISDRDLKAAVDSAAQTHSFHPVRDTIMAQPWDGIPRCERLFIEYLGCEDTPYHRQASLLTLVGAVTRIMEPGHKFDFVPILEGVQGKGKSTFIKVLALHWYDELTGDIKDTKQMIEVMQGSWILELGELSTMHRSEVNDLKAFVTRTHDKGRLAYAKRVQVFPRQCIFFGSTNDDEYLRDQTGNRRFWPIKCNLEGQIDNRRLAGEVLQVWAEALHLYREMRRRHNGDLPLHLTDEAAQIEAASIQESRRVETPEDVLAGKIEVWLDSHVGDDFEDLEETTRVVRNETCTAQIWEEVMGGRPGQMPNIEAMKIGRAMQILGWKRTENKVRTYEVNKRYGATRVYVRPQSND